jgi:hypothetical protein
MSRTRWLDKGYPQLVSQSVFERLSLPVRSIRLIIPRMSYRPARNDRSCVRLPKERV